MKCVKSGVSMGSISCKENLGFKCREKKLGDLLTMNFFKFFLKNHSLSVFRYPTEPMPQD